MKEFDIVYKREEISDNLKIYDEAITVTITLAEYRFLVEERQRFECELLKLNDVIADLQMKYEGMKDKYYELQNKNSVCELVPQTASLSTTFERKSSKSVTKTRSDNNAR